MYNLVYRTQKLQHESDTTTWGYCRTGETSWVLQILVYSKIQFRKIDIQQPSATTGIEFPLGDVSSLLSPYPRRYLCRDRLVSVSFAFPRFPSRLGFLAAQWSRTRIPLWVSTWRRSAKHKTEKLLSYRGFLLTYFLVNHPHSLLLSSTLLYPPPPRFSFAFRKSVPIYLEMIVLKCKW